METIRPRIYVVEDNPVYQALILQQLEDISEDLHVYSTGESMLDALADPPDLVVLDYNLEGPMNGYDALDALRDSGYMMHVILFSSNPDITFNSSCPSRGITTCMVKTIPAVPQLKQAILASLENMDARLEKIY